MTDDDAFLRAIQAAPNDAAPKLVYADWLDENEQPLRAEYLRLMIGVIGVAQPHDDHPKTNQLIRLAELQKHVGTAWLKLFQGYCLLGLRLFRPRCWGG